MGAYLPSWFVARLARVPEPDPGRETGQESGASHLTYQLGSLSGWVRNSHSSRIAANREVGVTVLLHGEIYGPSRACDAKGLLTSYLRSGPQVAQSLNGSYALLILDSRLEGPLVITDRVNSHKVFVSEDSGGWWLSTSLYRHPREGRRLDPAGIASVLSCGVAHSGLTPFDGVRALQGATVHGFTERGQSSERYWNYEFRKEYEPVRGPDLKGDLAGVLQRGVERRLPTGRGKVFVSLSGGYDSMSIASFLAGAIDDRERLQTFTYHRGSELGDTDFGTAALAATRLGLPHQRVEGYRGDLLSVLEANSSLGQGMANFCTEVDAWQRLGPVMAKSDENVLFVGDRFFLDPPRGSAGEVLLAQADVFPVSTIDWLLEGPDPSSASALRDGWQATYDGLLARIPSEQSAFDSLHRVGFDHYISDTLMLWRESFQMPYVRVAMPYLDNEVLDFMLGVPAQLRKTLYREAVSKTFPSLFGVPPARGGWNAPDWPRELRRHMPAVYDTVVSRASQLDDLVAPDVILSLLSAASGVPAAGSDEMAAGLRSLAKRSTPVRRIVRAVKPRVQRPVPMRRSRPRVLLDLLTLRGFLSDQPPRSVGVGSGIESHR